ncbi:uncharacterized protein K460DRAFT_405372 [Cucurbitaria berberidis CBS 394.84]|uniref:Uncharacterized protein n=1 Tax=Cucurbitaria berberidis CBS 394.84 TaxID=1168544 RepID=A0A9P4GGU6_9PLEO|nr:uncharacterized protein K460DRAFT_405372 [Cucurbitaria berberidis CBS 394.84]KAF1845097.1 hypothetical protein K460DRAFT_405372 [Cucurbitaria berberidis CBS 394.84]
MNRIITISTAVAVAATGTYLYRIQSHISPVPIHRISSSPQIPDALKQSKAALAVNPNGHVTITDTRFTTLELPNRLSDEQILARFVKGFFGGYVFGPESGVLRAVGKDLMRFERLKDIPVSSYIWAQSALSRETVPPLHSVLFGVFRVADCHFQSPGDEKYPELSQGGSYSYIDVAFGSEKGPIAGVHRFSVTRDGRVKEDGGKNESVTIEFAHVGCNPKENKPLKPDFVQTLHLWYAMLLFREGVAEVMK